MNRDKLLKILQDETDGFTEQSRLRDDILDAMVEVQKQAIDYAHSSSQLKKEETPTFEFWMDVNGYELDEYKFYKDQKGGLYFKIDLENMYKKEFNL